MKNLFRTKTGLEIRNGKTGIFIIYSHGRMTGEAYVQFRSSDDAENALKRNREKIGSRSVIRRVFFYILFFTNKLKYLI